MLTCLIEDAPSPGVLPNLGLALDESLDGFTEASDFEADPGGVSLCTVIEEKHARIAVRGLIPVRRDTTPTTFLYLKLIFDQFVADQQTDGNSKRNMIHSIRDSNLKLLSDCCLELRRNFPFSFCVWVRSGVERKWPEFPSGFPLASLLVKA